MNWPLIAAGVFVAWAMVMIVLIWRNDSPERRPSLISTEELQLALNTFGRDILRCLPQGGHAKGTANISLDVRKRVEYVEFTLDVPSKDVKVRMTRMAYEGTSVNSTMRALLVVAIAFRCMDREWGYVFSQQEKTFAEAAEKQLTDAGIEITIINKEQ